MCCQRPLKPCLASRNLFKEWRWCLEIDKGCSYTLQHSFICAQLLAAMAGLHAIHN